jgi:glycosyltransferase involved in cell wall biosynthesis
MPSMMRGFLPDAVVVTGTDPKFAIAALQRSAGQPSVLYVRVDAAVPAVLDAHVDLVLANSEFMARRVHELGVEATFLPSMFPPEDYEITPTREKVLFVNPIPKKGVEIALHLAESRPDIPFVFNLSWRIEPRALRALRRETRRLGNIEIRDATRRAAMLFRDCRLLLVPSQWEEPWGRVVSEAQIIGIPTVASRVGGLPESVGPGGILVSPRDSRQAWLKALSEAWDNDDRYMQLSERALEHSRRPEISVDLVIKRFEELLAQAVDRHSRRG